ncbi:MAG: hypothetical protein ACTSW1_00575 [Candidatus Hodarchaeales archaeon]
MLVFDALLVVLQALPIVYAAALEFADRTTEEHLKVSLGLAGFTALLMLIPAILAMLDLTTISFWGIELPKTLSLVALVTGAISNIVIYWITVGITKLVEMLVRGM